ncbi:MAG: hypothetical protein HC859_16270 [Bacteroidia bacterium]|nr:hypothetical protein [Bacteroidia bacterium]
MKKKALLLFMLVIVAAGAMAQTVQWTKVVGGGISYMSRNVSGGIDSEDQKYTDFSFTPSFGLFVADQALVGINVSFSSGKGPDFFGVSTEYSSFGVGPYFRYYKHTSNENFAFFGQVSVMFSSGSSTDYLDNEIKYSAVEAAVSPGFTYFVNEHWGAELWFRGIAFISSDPNKDADDDNETVFQFNINSLSPSIGIRYYF